MISPNLQNPFHGKHEGDVLISGETFELHGMIVGDVMIRDGGHFICYGMVTRSVNIDDHSSAIINGTVNGIVVGTGNIQIYGMVNNFL